MRFCARIRGTRQQSAVFPAGAAIRPKTCGGSWSATTSSPALSLRAWSVRCPCFLERATRNMQLTIATVSGVPRSQAYQQTPLDYVTPAAQHALANRLLFLLDQAAATPGMVREGVVFLQALPTMQWRCWRMFFLCCLTRRLAVTCCCPAGRQPELLRMAWSTRSARPGSTVARCIGVR